jgi:hypothetical protein
MVIIGGLGSIMGSFFGAAFIVVLPIVLTTVPQLFGIRSTRPGLAPELHDLRRADRVLPDRRAARPGALWSTPRKSCASGPSRTDKKKRTAFSPTHRSPVPSSLETRHEI